jgi:hypothetical protein
MKVRFLLDENQSPRLKTDTLQILWEASEAEDWINQENWIPF